MIRRAEIALVLLLAACRAPEAGAPPDAAVPNQPGAAALVPPGGDDLTAGRVRKAQALVAASPQDAEAWAALGEAWIQRARNAQQERLFRRAEAAAERALELDAASPRGRRVKALVLQTAHRFGELAKLAESMTAAHPGDASAWALLGDARLELGDYPGAEAAYQRLTDLGPGLPALSRVAWLRWLNGEVAGARRLWREALAAAPEGDPEPAAFCLAEAGHLEWNAGDLDAADALYRAALERLSTHAPSLFGRGRVALARGDAAAAVEAFERSVAARPLEETWAWLPVAYRRAGRRDDARRLESRLDASGAHEDPRMTALDLATRRVRTGDAVRLAAQDAASRGGVYADDALAFALLRAGRPAEAEAPMARALALGTPDPILLAHAGLLAVARGRRDEARALLGRALALNPHFHPWLAEEARAALAEP